MLYFDASRVFLGRLFFFFSKCSFKDETRKLGKCLSICVNVWVGVCYCPCSLCGSSSTSGLLDGVTCDLLSAEMQAMQRGGSIWSKLSRRGGVFVCVQCACWGDSPPRGWHILKSLMRLIQEEIGLSLHPVERWKQKVWVNRDLKWIWSKYEKLKKKKDLSKLLSYGQFGVFFKQCLHISFRLTNNEVYECNKCSLKKKQFRA